MRTIPCLLTGDRIEISEYHTKLIRQAVKDQGGPIRAEINVLTPESRKARAYLMGGILPLAVYLDGQDYKDSETCERYFEYYKSEFYPVAVKIEGKIRLFGKSTKGSKALKQFTERLQDYLHEQHGISYDNKAMNPECYKEWRDTLSMSTTDDWITFCRAMKYIE